MQAFLEAGKARRLMAGLGQKAGPPRRIHDPEAPESGFQRQREISGVKHLRRKGDQPGHGYSRTAGLEH